MIFVLKAHDKNHHEAADIVCAECKSIIATLHAPSAHRVGVRTKRAAKALEMAGQEIDRLSDPLQLAEKIVARRQWRDRRIPSRRARRPSRLDATGPLRILHGARLALGCDRRGRVLQDVAMAARSLVGAGNCRRHPYRLPRRLCAGVYYIGGWRAVQRAPEPTPR
jgi:hypothetical protein